MVEWDRIVRELGPMVFATAWRILGHAADTEDVVQEVFLQAHVTQQSEGIRCWPGLLRRLATCRALDRLRQRRVSVPLDPGQLLAHSADGPEAMAMERELADRLRHVIARLPRQEAAVFCLRYFDELSYEQIAQTLHIQVGAVGVALHKARTRLEGLLLATTQDT